MSNGLAQFNEIPIVDYRITVQYVRASSLTVKFDDAIIIFYFILFYHSFQRFYLVTSFSISI